MTERAQVSMDRGIDLVMGVLVVGLLSAYLLPIAVNALIAGGNNSSAWSAGAESLYTILPFFFVLALVIWVVRKATQ